MHGTRSTVIICTLSIGESSQLPVYRGVYGVYEFFFHDSNVRLETKDDSCPSKRKLSENNVIVCKSDDIMHGL